MMIRTIFIVLLSVGLIGIGYWGYKEHEEKNAVLIHAENNYQRAFHNLAYHMDLLHDKIGTSLAMNSSERLSPQFVDIWKLSSVAQADVSQLPLSLLPFHKTEEFLVNIGDFTYKTAIRDLDDEPLSDEEIDSLEKYYRQSAIVKDELRKVQHVALTDNLRWMDVELALITNDTEANNSIIDSFKTVEKGSEQFADGNKDNPFLTQEAPDHSFKHLRGDRKNEEDIIKLTRDLFDIHQENELQINKGLDGAVVENYNVSYEDDKQRIFMDVTEIGAHPVTILVNRDVEEQQLSLNDGMIEAENYLKSFDYEDMVLLQSQQFDNVGVYTFLYRQDDVWIYPDSVIVKVGLDNGDIIGLNARNYLKNNEQRQLNEPKITLEEAEAFVNKNLDIQTEHLALIENSIGEEVLTYAFLGTLHDETYRIFINAENGIEEKIEKLTGTETNYDVNI